MEALRIERLTKMFGGIYSLQDVSFSVEAGERLAIIGPNGAGKSTLFNVLAGQLPATQGRVFLFGRDVTATPPHRRARLGIARSFQVSNLFFNLTVLDNMLLAIQGTRAHPFQMFHSIEVYGDMFEKARRFLSTTALWEKGMTSCVICPTESSVIWKSCSVWPQNRGSCSWTNPRQA